MKIMYRRISNSLIYFIASVFAEANKIYSGNSDSGNRKGNGIVIDTLMIATFSIKENLQFPLKTTHQHRYTYIRTRAAASNTISCSQHSSVLRFGWHMILGIQNSVLPFSITYH